MEARPATAARQGAFLALALADALSLGLPDPDYITISPWLGRSARTPAIDFQFNDRDGRPPLAAMQAWAAHHGATIRVEDGDPTQTWHKFDFTYAGVLFHGYAAIKALAEVGQAASLDSEAWTCARCGAPCIGGRPENDLCKDCARLNVPACGAERDGRRCVLEAHEGGEHDAGGWHWSDVTYSVPHRHDATGTPLTVTDSPSAVGTIVARVEDDSPVPFTGRAVGQVDEDYADVAWGDQQDADYPSTHREPFDGLRPVRRVTGADVLLAAAEIDAEMREVDA